MVRRELKEEEDSLIVALTYRCNSRCHFCILEKELNHYADPDVAILEPIFRENGKNRRFRRLILSGAEVTLREDLADLAARATGKGGFEVVRIQTNGRRLSDPALARRLFEAGIREYFVSVHAHQAAHTSAGPQVRDEKYFEVNPNAENETPKDIGAKGGNVGLLDGSARWKPIQQMRPYRASQLWDNDGAFGLW